MTRLTARLRLRGAGPRWAALPGVTAGLMLGCCWAQHQHHHRSHHNTTAPPGSQARRSEYVLEVFIDYKMCYALKFFSYFVHDPALFSGYTCSAGAGNTSCCRFAPISGLFSSRHSDISCGWRGASSLQDSLNESWLWLVLRVQWPPPCGVT